MTTLDAIAGVAKSGTLYGIGVGPGDVRYLTLRAVGVLRSVDVIGYFAKNGHDGNARTTVAPLLDRGTRELKFEYPFTSEISSKDACYRDAIADFYGRTAATLTSVLKTGASVGLLSEGDPFFYGSFMHMWRRLERDFPIEVVPGVTGMSGCWTRANAPITWGDDVLTVIPGTLEEAVLTARLTGSDAAVIMKIGRNLAKVRRAVEAAGLLERAIYVERGTMSEERIIPLSDCAENAGPYFAMVLIPGPGAAAMTGSLTIVGLGPGAPELTTPAVAKALAAATDLVGYDGYLARVPNGPAGQRRHASDNRQEIARARHALSLASEGRTVTIVSGGDPGVFAMAAAVFEAVENGEASWRGLDIRVEPGVTAMLAAAAAAGAPLGGDFCAISLSDNLKSWETIARRLEAAARGDFVIALYNPASRARPHQLGEAFALLRRWKDAETPVVLARAAGSHEARLTVTTLGDPAALQADMRTVVLIGASTTRLIAREGAQPWVYTPRSEKALT